MNLWYFHLSSNLPSALEEFKTRHEVEGRDGLRAAPPDPPSEHGGILKPVCLRDAALRQKKEVFPDGFNGVTVGCKTAKNLAVSCKRKVKREGNLR